MASLADKVILITGGTKGIGEAIAIAAVKAGAKVALNYSSDVAQATKFVEELGSDKAIAIQADASSIAGVGQIVQATVKQYGRIDVLIPNAGILLMNTVESTSEEDFDKSFALNVKGPYFLVQKALPHMGKGSKVIFVSSSVIHTSQMSPNYLLYASTKGAIETMTYSMAKDLASKGITVNAVAPGPTNTELFTRGKSPELIKMISSSSPFNRIGEPEEVGDVFIFLAGDASRWISGQVIGVNGATSLV